MEYLHKIDPEQHRKFGSLAVQPLVSGKLETAGRFTVTCIRTPPGSGSPRGSHSHSYVQLFYLISGTMDIEIDGESFRAEPETVIVFPAGVPHHNWNAGATETVHLSIQLGEDGEPPDQSSQPKVFAG